MTTSITLADIAARIDMLEMRCSRCGRAGRRRVTRLIERHGGSMLLPDLRMKLVQGCDRAGGYDYDRNRQAARTRSGNLAKFIRHGCTQDHRRG